MTIGNHDSDLIDPRRFKTEIARTGAALIGWDVPGFNPPISAPTLSQMVDASIAAAA